MPRTHPVFCCLHLWAVSEAGLWKKFWMTNLATARQLSNMFPEFGNNRSVRRCPADPGAIIPKRPVSAV